MTPQEPLAEEPQEDPQDWSAKRAARRVALPSRGLCAERRRRAGRRSACAAAVSRNTGGASRDLEGIETTLLLLTIVMLQIGFMSIENCLLICSFQNRSRVAFLLVALRQVFWLLMLLLSNALPW